MISTSTASLLTGLCVIAGAFALQKLWPFIRTIYKASKIPTSESLPGLGHMHILLKGQEYCFNAFRRISKSCDGLFRLNIGHIVLVSSNDPLDLQTISSHKNIINRDKYTCHIFRSLMGDGLLTLRDDVWKTHRKIILPTFNMKILEGFVPTFSEKNSIFVDKLKKLANGTEIDLLKPLAVVTFEMVHATLMGLPPGTHTEVADNIVPSLMDVLDLIYERYSRPWLFFDCIFFRTQSGAKQRKVLDYIHSIGDHTVNTKLALYRQGNGNNEAVQEREIGTVKTRKAFLDLLIEISETQEKKLTIGELKAEHYTIALTALESSVTTLCFVFVLLGLYPEIQDKVYKELHSIFEDDMTRPITPEDISQMYYLEQVIKEALRLYPTAQFLPREIPEDVHLKTWTLPAGSTFVLMPFYTHRDPKYFPNPDHFDPDRFSPENIRNIQPYSYYPFGLGARACIGNKYAMISMKTTLASLLRSCRVLPAMTRDDLEHLTMGVSLRPTTEFRTKLELR